MTQELTQLLKNPNGRKAAVVGAGVSGQSAAALLHKLGAIVSIFDEKNGGSVHENALQGFDFIVLSPGFARSKAPIVLAVALGIPVVSEIDLAFVHLSNCRFIGVTGTNGKSTTTAMIGEILKSRDPKAFVGGNLGRPLCDAVIADETPSYAVLELSSYQLETLSLLRLDVAIVTHLSPDHLDRYKSEEDYYRAKNNIFALLKADGFAVINRKDPRSVKYLSPTQSQINFNVPLSFSMPKVFGVHNLENAAAAFAATRALGFDTTEIERALVKFEGMPHRLELIGSIDEVRWFNDSKATNVESAITAVKSFAGGIHLILGGVGKGVSYAPLVEASLGRVKSVYVIGEEAENIEAAFTGQIPVVTAGTLEIAVAKAAQNTSKGDVILLAPACASFDQYPNYVVRGDHMKQLFHTYLGSHHHA